MGQITTKYTCGHSSKKPVAGKSRLWDCGDRCAECRRADTARAARESAATLPALTGSPKQVEWATRVRYRVLTDLDRHDPATSPHLRVPVLDLLDAVLTGADSVPVAVEPYDRDAIRDQFLRETNAGWWCDRASHHITRLIRECQTAASQAAVAAKEQAYADSQSKMWTYKHALRDRVNSLLPPPISHWVVQVWDRGGDRRVYIRDSALSFGGNAVEYYHTGNHRHPPGTLRLLLAAKDCDRDPVLALCRDLSTQWTTFKYEARS